MLVAGLVHWEFRVQILRLDSHFQDFSAVFIRLSPLFELFLLDFEASESRYLALTYKTLISTDR